MIFEEIPFTPNDWINTSKVSHEWMDLTLGSIKKIESCHLLVLDHLADFINQQRNTNYSWVSLLTLMPKLEHLECFESTEAFWREIRPVCNQLKIFEFRSRNFEFYDWNKLDITFCNLTELRWDGMYQGPEFPFNLLAFSPKLEKLTLKCVKINGEWQKKIPKSVKHILLDMVNFTDEFECSVNDLCEDTSALETLTVESFRLPKGAASKFLDETPRLKNLDLDFGQWDETTSMIIKNALRKYRGLESVKANGVNITHSWRRIIPENVTCIDFFNMNVHKNIRRDFSFNWLFDNYGCLQSLKVEQPSWTGFDSQKFHSTKSLKKLGLLNYMSEFESGRDDSMDLFSDICLRMIRGSHLVDVESWRHIFPPTIKRLKLYDVYLPNAAKAVFSPQFICANPSRIESFILGGFHGDLLAINLNAFTGFHMLQKLNLNDLRLSGEGLQSILTHCCALTDLVIHELEDGALTNIPHNLVLPSLRKLDVNEPVDQHAILLQHFPKVRTVNITIVPPEASFSAIMNALGDADTFELKIRHLSWDLLSSLVESIDDTKFKYFCLSLVSIECKEFSFYWTNSLLDASLKLNDIIISRVKGNVLWIKNYPTSPLVRKHGSTIPSSMEELSQRYNKTIEHKDMKPWQVGYDDDVDEEEFSTFTSRIASKDYNFDDFDE